MSWKTTTLGEIALEDRRIIPPHSSEAKLRPYLGLEQIEANTGRILTYETTSSEAKSSTFAFDASHVLYGKLRPYLNKVALPNRMGRCSTEIIPLKPLGVNREFLGLVMRTENVLNAAMSEKTGSRMPRADMDALLRISIRIPESIDVQSKIAACLNARLIEVEVARFAAAEQARAIVTLRARLLTETFASVDGPLKILGDFAQTTSGATPPRGDKRYWLPADIPWVKTGEVTFSEITETEEAISRAALAECSLTLLPPGSVLIAMIGQGKTRGQSAILNIEATTNQNCFAVLPNETWESEFLFYWFMASYQRLRTLSADRGGSQSALNGTLLGALSVPAPDKTEQLRIVQQVKAALSEIDLLETNLKSTIADIKQLPNRILAQAFEN